MGEAYRDAVRLAMDETGLPLHGFPADCPYSLDQAMDQEFLPEG
jgi:hypothetical protein